MMNLIEKFEAKQVEELSAVKPTPEFAPGDTIRVNVKVIEGTRERIQAFEGVCISRSRNGGINASFTVRKLSYGEGVERVFPLYSPIVSSIDVIRRGDVRRAKLYYLRGRTGKSARIAEKTTGYAAKVSANEKRVAAETKAAADTRARKAKNQKKAAETSEK